jgi:hypothetical protein
MLKERHIREVWPQVKAGLEAVKAKVPNASDWRTEDVYAEVLYDKARLLMDDASPEAGFVILFVNIEQYSQRKELFIWVAYSPLGDAADQYLDDLKAIAHEQGCSHIVMSSPRTGFTRRPEWQAITTEYRLPL